MFWTFNQNNSGGSFDVDDDVSFYVIIEADDPQEANEKAEDIGVYFNGVDAERDCECCGDRWYELSSYDTGSEEPTIYGNKLDSPTLKIYGRSDLKAGQPAVWVYYKDGTKKGFNYNG